MKSVILIKARPGYELIRSHALTELAKKAQGVTIRDVVYCFGRVDGVIFCDAENLQAFARFDEFVRREGNFMTETLVGIE